MTKQRKRQYRIRNWRDYNSALVRRGSLTLWGEQSALDRWRDAGGVASTPTSTTPAP